jgi:hypothetical protein
MGTGVLRANGGGGCFARHPQPAKTHRRSRSFGNRVNPQRGGPTSTGRWSAGGRAYARPRWGVDRAVSPFQARNRPRWRPRLGLEPPMRRGVTRLTTGHESVGMPSRFLGPWAFLQGMGGCPRVIPESVGCGCSSGVEHNLPKVGVEGSNPFARSNPHLGSPPILAHHRPQLGADASQSFLCRLSSVAREHSARQ